MVQEIRRQQIDTTNNGIDANEWNAWKTANRDATDGLIIIADDGSKYYYSFDDLENGTRSGNVAVADAGHNISPTEATALHNAARMKGELESLLRQFNQIKAEGGDTTEIANQIKEALRKYENFVRQANSRRPFDTSKYNDAVKHEGSGGTRGTVRSGQMPGGEGGGQGGNMKAASAGGASFYPPAGWNAPMPGTGVNPSAAFLAATALVDNIKGGFADEINQNQNRGKQLMMLFFYFARMAESGDMGAMYQFMKFITFIISKDKAKQQIEMGKKLIELQELSRQWTNKLLNLKTDASDPNSSNEFTKVMMDVKSHTDEAATSQKLISQMMEEFSQVVETLTNVTKSALETNGRILRAVSTIR